MFKFIKWLLLFLILISISYGFYWLTPPVGELKTLGIKTSKDQFIRYEGENWKPLKEVSKNAVYAFLSAEDSRFYQHYGIDFKEITESIKLNWSQKKYARGASTISQQVVRLAFLENEKSFYRKIREAIGAFYLEFLFSKEDILAWYFLLIPLGHNIEGIHEAARFYFRTNADLLTINESIWLAMILPRPSEWSQDISTKRLSPGAKRRFLRILDEMLINNYITKVQHKQAILTGDFGSPVKLIESKETEIDE